MKAGQLPPVVSICGNEVFFLDQAQKIISDSVPPTERDFNFDLLHGTETGVEQVIAVSNSFPLMAERRVVIVRDFMKLGQAKAGAAGDKAKSGVLGDLLPYVERPNPQTLLVLIDESKPAGNTKLGKALKKKDPKRAYFEFARVPEYKVPDWITEWAATRHDKKIEHQAAQILAQHVGNNLLTLSSEIDKLCTYKGSANFISVDDIHELTGISKEYSIFELKKAIIRRDLDGALFISEQMLRQGDSDTGEVIKTIAFLYSVYSNIWKILRLKARGLAPAQIRQQAGVKSPAYFENLMTDARGYSVAQMPMIFETLLDADKAVKGFGKVDPAGILQMTIKKIIARR